MNELTATNELPENEISQQQTDEQPAGAEAKLSDNITWAQIKTGFQEYCEREVAAKQAARSVAAGGRIS